MTDVFRRFLLKIGITEHGPYEKADYSVKYDKENDICYMTITNPTLFKYKQYKEILDGLDKAPFKTSMSFKYLKGYNPEDVFNLLKEQFILTTGMDENSLPHHKFASPNSITFIFNGKVQYDSFKLVVETWEELLDSADINLDIETDIVYASESVTEQRNKELLEQMNKIQETYSPLVASSQANQTQGQRVKGLFEPVKLHDLNDSMVNRNVSFQGLVFKSDERISRKNKMIVTLFVYDKTDSIEVTVFENRRNFARERIAEFKENGTHVLVRGHVSLSKYTQEVGIIADFITPLEEKFEEERVDEEEEKRVELHLHTQMSAMDAVTNIAAYCQRAAKWGHKAIAITDHCNVQAFPEAQVAGKKSGIKVLYGCEMNMVDDELQYIFNPSPIELNKATYVVFDFETTGLSARYDKIIEFGAVKFKDGMIVDKMDLLIDPEMELSKTTTDLTHITTAMVKGQIKIKEALKIMKRFIGDAILVAHNAVFDVGFLNQAFINNGEEKITNPVIDTLPISRYLFPDNKAHSLGALCRQFEVSYDENVAHRADYDAKVLNDAWQAMLVLLTKENIHLRHEELSLLQNEKILKGLRPKHITVFAKNAQGLKDLFKLVSLSNIKYYAGGTTKIPRREIVAYRENLLIGSACFNGEVFDTALTRSRDILNETVKFYDFIEVQPPSNYDYLVNIGDVSSLEHIKHIIKDIITAADDEGKLVVATGDCHYLDPKDKIFRDVYIFGKTVGGGRHPLNPYKRERYFFSNPDQHFRTTREMLDEFAFLGEERAKEIVIKNTNLIADMMEEVYPVKDRLYPPHIKDDAKLLVTMVWDKAKSMYGDPLPDIVKDRLDAELGGILKYGYTVQYYIASQIVMRTNALGYMVGSRGSVGSSLVATMSNITEVNALPPHYRCPKCLYSDFSPDVKIYRSGFDLPEKKCPHCGTDMIRDGQNIPFATFLGFKAEKVPDIDLNFSAESQSKAHDMTKDLLGVNNVFRAGTIETVAEKTAYGYVLGYYESMGIDPKTIRNAEKERIALGCQDVKRTTGQHPGGIIVIPDDMEVYDFTPIQYPAEDMTATWKTTHFDFHKIHDNVLKLDLLGHVDPTALKMLGDMTGIPANEVPLTDKNVISLFSTDKALKRHSNYLNEKTGALGLPEFGTPFVRQMLVETQPQTFADLLIISGLSHGTDVWNGNAQDLINEKICTLQQVIGCRDDIMVGLMNQGIEPSTAFKIMEDVRKGKQLKPEYEDLLRENKVPEWYINSCNKIKYLFPKAHAVAYVMMACRVAWYKVYYPLEYYAVFFSTRSKQFDIKVMAEGEKAIVKRLEEYKEIKSRGEKLSPKEEEIEKTLNIALEMAERGYKIGMIDINKSLASKFIIDKEHNMIIPPFDVLDNLGSAAADTVVEARDKMEFISIEDLQRRTKLSQTNIDSLKKLGALKDLPERNQLTLF